MASPRRSHCVSKFFFSKTIAPFASIPVLFISLAVLLNGCKAAHTVPPSARENIQGGISILFKSGDLAANVVDIFSRETGIGVAVQLCGSDLEMQQLLNKAPGTYDVIEAGESLASDLVERGKLAPLSYQTIPNLRHLNTHFMSMPFDSSNRYTAPYYFGAVGIAYNSEEIEGAVRTYSDIFNPKFSGRIVIPNDPKEILACVLADLHLRFESLTVSNSEDIRRQLSHWIPLAGKYSPQMPPQSILRRGEAVAAILRSGQAAILIRENPKFKWVLPAGSHLVIESIGVPADSLHRQQAQEFINFLLRPDISAKITRQVPYLNPNLAAKRLLFKENQQYLLPEDFPTKDLQLLPSSKAPIAQELVNFIKDLQVKTALQ